MNDITSPPFLDATVLVSLGDAAPAGRDLTYEPHVEKLAAEVEKITSLAGEIPDWAHIRRESGRILREETKDLRVASWWVAATAYVEGWAALAEALTTFAALLEQFWNEMHPPPKRARARAGLIGWLWQSLAKALPAKGIALADANAVRAVDAAVNGIDRAMAEKLGEASPTLGALRGVVREKLRSIPEPPSAAAVSPSRAEAPSGAEAPSAAEAPTNGSAVRSVVGSASVSTALPSSLQSPLEAGPLVSLEDTENAAARFREGLLTLAHHARRMVPTSPWPYRLARVAAWIALESAPAVENGKTFARAPRQADRTALAQMFDGGQWDALRGAAEEALSESSLWLDLHRYTSIALERLGPTYAAARASVGRETAMLVERLPSLPSLLFANGTPLASPETVDWLLHERARYAGSATGPSAKTRDDGLGPLLAEADARAAAGQVDEGIAAVLAAANEAPAARGRFRARLAAAHMAYRSGKASIAQALLERLLPEVDATLEAWEPSVCAEFFEIFLKVERTLSSEGGDRQSLLFRRLLQVDPAAALRNG